MPRSSSPALLRDVVIVRLSPAFSLVEVTIALGVIAFVLLSVVGILSIGIRSNRISVEETRAASLLTLIEADLRNTYPISGASAIFGLTLPYTLDAGKRIFNPSLANGSFSTTGINDAEQAVSFAANARPRYQATVVYTRVPASGQLGAMQARLIVNWPGTNIASAADLTGPAKSAGSVEAVISFPAP